MLHLIVIASVIVALCLVLLGVNIFIFRRDFPQTEVGKNRNMIRLGIRCPHCEERIQYRKFKPVKIKQGNLVPDWKQIYH
jgi:hypothetical protein